MREEIEITIANYCVGCAFCKLICPEEAIRVNGRAEVDVQRCVECKKCVVYCPVEAIRIVK